MIILLKDRMLYRFIDVLKIKVKLWFKIPKESIYLQDFIMKQSQKILSNTSI